MNAFDEKIRKSVQAENMRLNPEAEVRFEQAMAKARTQQTPKRRMSQWVALVTALCMMIPLAVFVWQLPSREDVRNGMMVPYEQPTIQPLSQPKAPLVYFDAYIMEETLSVEGRFRNDADEIWLVEWSAEEEGGLVWLEPGAECVQRASWEGRNQAEVAWKGYRVTSDFLHWMDGAYLTPEDEGYADQQLLIEDAFANGAIVLAPGEWENGEAGPMELVLPAIYKEENPEANAVEVYVQSGDLTDESAVCFGKKEMKLEENL